MSVGVRANQASQEEVVLGPLVGSRVASPKASVAERPASGKRCCPDFRAGPPTASSRCELEACYQ